MKALAYIGLFFFAIDHLRTPHHIQQSIWAITFTAAITAVIGICQHFAGFSAIYGWRDASYAHFFGPFLNRNHFAAYQAMAIFIGLGLWAALSHGQRPPLIPVTPAAKLATPFASAPLLWLLLFALAIMTGALGLTLSRGGMLSFFVGLSLFILLHRQSRRRRGLSVHLPLRLTWVFVGLALVSFWLGLGPLVDRFWHSLSGDAVLAWGDRRLVYTSTWAMVSDFPIFGIGLGAFPVLFPRYQPADVTLRYLQAHSDTLQLLAETGVVGWIACLGNSFGLVAGILKAWRQSHCELTFAIVPAGFAAMGAITLHSCVDFSLRIPANAVLLTVILAVTHRCANLPPQDIRYGASV